MPCLGVVVSYWKCGFVGLVVEVRCWGDALGGKVRRELYAKSREFRNGFEQTVRTEEHSICTSKVLITSFTQ
jgi:hypothetical protein